MNDHHLVVDGKVTVTQINDLLLTELDTTDVDTIGGWLFGMHPEMNVGEIYTHDNLDLKLLEKEPHRFRKVEIIKKQPTEQTP
ncbi:Transporter associated domain protein [compost metagenome]